ncbi:unnamed protein product, partial [Pleuronectes platessa]
MGNPDSGGAASRREEEADAPASADETSLLHELESDASAGLELGCQDEHLFTFPSATVPCSLISGTCLRTRTAPDRTPAIGTRKGEVAAVVGGGGVRCLASGG